MVEPNQKLIDEKVPCITLAQREWPVPLLAPKQNRIVVPRLLRLAPRFVDAFKGGINFASLASALDEQSYDELLECAYQALTRAHEITRAEFDNMSIGTLELVSAFQRISVATGVLKEAPTGVVPMGEGPAASP